MAHHYFCGSSYSSPRISNLTFFKVSVGQCLNLVRVQHQVQGILESSEFIGPRELVDQPMLVDGSGANSYTIQTVDEATVLVLEFFHSRNIHRRDPLDLPGEGDVSRNLQVSSVCLFSLCWQLLLSKPIALVSRCRGQTTRKTFLTTKRSGLVYESSNHPGL